MATSIWYLITSLLLVSIAGRRYDDDSQSFYENSESSSPAPQSSPSLREQAEGKEVILYLTSEQVQVLKSAGAVVKPIPEFEKQITQEQYQQQSEGENRPLFQPNNEDETRPTFQRLLTEDSKEENERESYFKASNLQQQDREGDENSSIENEFTEEATEKPQPNYKYTYKTRQQEYSTLDAIKNLNKGKTEYVRYRSGYPFEDLRIKSQPQASLQTKTPEPRQPIEIRNLNEFRQVVGDLTRYLNIKSTQAEEQQNEPGENSFNIEDKGPVTFQDKSQEPAKVWEPAPVRQSSKIIKLNKQADAQLKVKGTKLRTIQRQYASLMAPLVQHEKITQSLDEQKQELLNNEREIKIKLQQLKESDSHDEEQYAAEIDKLNQNLVKQNELAQKLALEAAAKKSRPLLIKKSEVNIKGRRPIIESQNQEGVAKPIRVLVQIPQRLEWKLSEQQEGFRPIRGPVQQNEKTREETPLATEALKPAPVPAVREYYVNTDRPLLQILQKENEYKPEIPSSLAIIRHIWDH